MKFRQEVKHDQCHDEHGKQRHKPCDIAVSEFKDRHAEQGPIDIGCVEPYQSSIPEQIAQLMQMQIKTTTISILLVMYAIQMTTMMVLTTLMTIANKVLNNGFHLPRMITIPTDATTALKTTMMTMTTSTTPLMIAKQANSIGSQQASQTVTKMVVKTTRMKI